MAINHEKLSGETSSDIVRYLVEAISIVVVAIPEGLPLAVTMVRAQSIHTTMISNNITGSGLWSVETVARKQSGTILECM